MSELVRTLKTGKSRIVVGADMDDSVLSRAEEFFYFDDDLPLKIENWAASRCETFSNANSEHPIVHHQYYEEYQQLFASIIEDFIRQEGMDITRFYREIANESHKNNFRTPSFSSILSSTLSFESFCEMMNSVREGNGVVYCPPLIDITDEPSMMSADEKFSMDYPLNDDKTYDSVASCKEYRDCNVDSCKYYK